MTAVAVGAAAGGVVLEANDVSVTFRVHGARLTAVDRVSLALREQEVVGLVGESGCGKTTLARALVGLLQPEAGTIALGGSPVSGRRSASERRAVQIVFQDPCSSLNPRLSVRRVLTELLTVHGLVPRSQAESRCRELMSLVGLRTSALDGYPSAFSGGQRQRIAIARALAVEPRVLIADEPTSALDVSVQAAVLDLFDEIRTRLGVSILFISHNLAAVRHLCERVAVMYLGGVVELGSREQIFSRASHPYTQALLASAPRIRPTGNGGATLLRGEPQSVTDNIRGCPFRPRCPRAEGICADLRPPLAAVVGERSWVAACHFRDEAVK